jgi:hypothetical protein
MPGGRSSCARKTEEGGGGGWVGGREPREGGRGGERRGRRSRAMIDCPVQGLGVWVSKGDSLQTHTYASVCACARSRARAREREIKRQFACNPCEWFRWRRVAEVD